jgi:hypothetical protein
VKFPTLPIATYDPLRDRELLDMLRSWFRVGEAVIMPMDVDCYRSHREAVEALSGQGAEELGLKDALSYDCVSCH